MKNGIHVIENYGELAELRQLTIGNSDFLIDENAVGVDAKDERSLNLGHFQQGKLLAAMRFYPVTDRQELERQLDYPAAHKVAVTFPGVVIGKAGSLPEARGKGLIRELLIHGLRHFEQQKIGFAALTTKPSNRLNGFIEGLGFSKDENPAGWHRFGYNSQGATLVFLKRFDLELLISRTEHALETVDTFHHNVIRPDAV